MSAAPRVAVITPTYNQESYITRCMSSVFRQTMPDWEMVIVDDGSSDGTAEIAEATGDARVRVIRLEHRGLARIGETYAAGLAATSAPFVAILEGDDEWPPDKLERQLQAFEDPDVVLSYGAASQIDEWGCAYATYARRPPGMRAHNRPVGTILSELVRQNFIVAPTVIVRRSSLELVGGFWQPAGIPYVDHPTWMLLALVGPFAYEPHVVGRWRRHAAQFTTSGAVGPQPDNRQFILDVLGRAEEIAVPEVAAMREVVAEGPARHARWSDISAFRLALLSGTLRDAANASTDLLATRRPKWVALGVAGLLCRLAGSDLEWIFRATQRFSWPSRRHRRRHEPR